MRLLLLFLYYYYYGLVYTDSPKSDLGDLPCVDVHRHRVGMEGEERIDANLILLRQNIQWVNQKEDPNLNASTTCTDLKSIRGTQILINLWIHNLYLKFSRHSRMLLMFQLRPLKENIRVSQIAVHYLFCAWLKNKNICYCRRTPIQTDG
jgi:hypothetical protein